MAAGAIADIEDPLFPMLGQNLVGTVLMAAEAGVAGEIAAGVAGGALNVVRPGQREEALMIEGGRSPALWRVAGRTLTLHTAMQGVGWCDMAGRAACPGFGAKQVMGKARP